MIRRLLWFAAALLVAGVFASVAPDPWPTEGNVQVELADGTVLTAPTNGPPDQVQAHFEDGQLAVQIQPGLDPKRVTYTVSANQQALIPMSSPTDASRIMPVSGSAVLGLLGMVVVLWLSEAVPLWLTGILVPTVLVVLGVRSAEEALAPFFHPVIALFFAGFMLAQAMNKTGLDRRVALEVVAAAGKSPITLYTALLGTSAVASMFMSNTAAAAMLMPIALLVCAPLGDEGSGYRRAVVLGIAYAATLGGVGSAIGTPSNPLAIQYLATVGREVSFAKWFAYGLPMVLMFLPVVGAWVWWSMGAGVTDGAFAQVRASAAHERSHQPAISRDEKRLITVFVLIILAWLSDGIHGVHPGIVGLGGVVVLGLFGLATSKTLAAIDWGALLTFGGGLSMGMALGETGISQWLATHLEVVASLPSWTGLAALALLSLLLTAVASNTASAAILIPLALPLASVLGEDPALLILVIAVASSIDFALVIGTPPTMIAHSTGQVTAPEVFRIGSILDLAGLVVLLTGVVAFWRLFGLVG